MRVVFALAILALLMSVASAETIQFGNYTATFDMKEPHIIVNNTIRTYYGFIYLIQGIKLSTTDLAPIIAQDHEVGVLNFDRESYDLYVDDEMAYLVLPHNWLDTYIISSINLTNTLDFLKSLKIEKTKAT
jgi:hypothetical protein